MQALCCCSGRKAYPDRELSTPTTQLPARPVPAKWSKGRPQGRRLNESSVPLDPTQAPSLMTTPRHQAVLNPLDFEVGISDSEDGRPDQKSSPTSAIGAFKIKLIRRLSQKSQSKRESQQSIGNSEEELARRAELRRLRQKRIQEELETEEESETKSNEETPAAHTSQSLSELPDLPGGGPRDNIEFSVCETDDVGSSSSSTPAPEMVALALPIVAGIGTTLQHRSSYLATDSQPPESSVLGAENVVLDHGPLPEMPVSPQLEPVDLFDPRASSSIASWRLSYSAGQLAEYIGGPESNVFEKEDMVVGSSSPKTNTELPPSRTVSGSPSRPTGEKSRLSIENGSEHVEEIDPGSSTSSVAGPKERQSSVPGSVSNETHFEQSTGIFHNTTNSDQYSPLDLWLRVSNTLQSMSHSSTRRNSDSILENRPNASVLDDFSSSRPSPKAGPSLSPCNRDSDSILLKVPGSFPPTKGFTTNTIRANQGPKQIKPRRTVSLDVHRGWVTGENSSSRFTTRPNSADLTRSVSNLSFVGLVKKRGESLSGALNKILGPNGMTDADKSETSSYRTAPIQPVTAGVVIHGKENIERLPPGSAAASETASFKQREAELESVEKRFAEATGRRHVSSSVVSRFREEFDAPEQSHRKPSLFARFLPKKGTPRRTLHKQNPFPHSGHRNCVGDAIAASNFVAVVPSTSVAPKGQYFSNEEGTLKLEETATDLWQRAIRLEADRREAHHRHQAKPQHIDQNSQLEIPHSREASSGGGGVTPHTLDASSVYSRSQYGDKSGIQSPKPRPVTGHDDTQLTSASLEASNHILKEWQHQIQSEVSGIDRAPSFTTHIYATRNPSVIPESWAKWSSHDRAERNGATGSADHVTPRDFVIVSNTVGNDAKRSVEKESHAPAPDHNHATQKQTSFSSKLGRTFRGSFAKFLPNQDCPQSGLDNVTENYKRRPGSTGHLEYPELELLPSHGGYKELEALEKTIDHIKRPPVTIGTRPRGLSGASSRTPLSLRFAQDVHKYQHDNRNGSIETGELPNVTEIQHPNTPVGGQPASRTISGTTQAFDTPTSHISYDDCVPRHMLDENDSSKSDSTALVKRSKSTAEHTMPGFSHKYSTWNGRAKSVSIKRMRACGSELEKMLVAERAKTMYQAMEEMPRENMSTGTGSIIGG
ncbi:hypothetical protein SUNI508_01714 [Seiridium unicorne]|uniref:Uncharacterized protein n=1 Tax=Seiridium unicorne TaxID=138068 RepID=A0ABR2UNT2_9PEZI